MQTLTTALVLVFTLTVMVVVMFAADALFSALPRIRARVRLARITVRNLGFQGALHIAALNMATRIWRVTGVRLPVLAALHREEAVSLQAELDRSRESRLRRYEEEDAAWDAKQKEALAGASTGTFNA